MVGQGDKDAERLRRRVRDVINAYDDRSTIPPEDVADRMLKEFDPDGVVRRSFPNVYLAAHLCIRQIARELLRKTNGSHTAPEMEIPEGENVVHLPAARQPSLPWDDPRLKDLQDRYPTSPDKKHRGYVLRDQMDEADWRHNVNAFAKKLIGESRHLAALRAWGAWKKWSMPGDEKTG